MTTARTSHPTSFLRRCSPLLLLLAALPALAQYKVVGPDGKITYTDRAPTTEGKVSPISGRGSGGTADASLPLELRQVVGRFPVTLYVGDSACGPCESGRQLLRQRGVPYTEKSVLTPADGDALERLSGGRDAPTLTIGGQTLRGLAPDVWASYLDAAGYPRDSQLPANYQYASATPLVERQAAARPQQAPSPGTPATPSATPAGTGGIRF